MAAPAAKGKSKRQPYYILAALVAGIVFGYLFPAAADTLKPFGDAFVKMIKMIIVPLVLATLTTGIAGAGDFKKMGKLGGKTLLWFTFASTIALILGLVLANVIKPGSGVELMKVAPPSGAGKTLTLMSNTDLLLSVIPSNIFEALATANMLQIVFFSCFFGVAVASLGSRGKPIIDFMTALMETMFAVTNYVMKLTPIAVFALVGWTVGKYGLDLIIPLGKLIATLYLGLVIFIVLVLWSACLVMKVSFFQVLRAMKQPLILAFTTCSSEAALPLMLENLQKFGVPKHIVSFVLPTGYSFNLDGSILYKCMALIFIAQMYNIPLDFSTQVMMLVTMAIVQKGSAGVPGAAFMGLSFGVVAFHLPMEGLFMIMGIDRLLDMGRTSTNVIGNAVASILVARWEGELPPEAVQAGYTKNYD
jgi:proton glutamate symport protein